MFIVDKRFIFLFFLRQVMSTKVYVGNLSYDTNENGLNELFSQYGEIASLNLIIDKITGKSKGFAFVEMTTEDAAQQVINELNGKDFEGRKLKVNAAFDKQDKPNNKRFNNNRGFRKERY
jgi:RNA recognition motif-containing protein